MTSKDTSADVDRRTAWFAEFAQRGEEAAARGEYAVAAEAFRAGLAKGKSAELAAGLSAARQKMRDEWRASPNFDATAGALLYFHEGYRRGAREFVKAGAAMGKSASLDERMELRDKVVAGMRRLFSSMSMHHRIEESHMFPGLQRRFGVDCSVLEHDHEEMDVMRDRVYGLGSASSDKALAELAALAENFGEFLLEHLAREEDLCCPHMIKARSIHDL